MLVPVTVNKREHEREQVTGRILSQSHERERERQRGTRFRELAL